MQTKISFKKRCGEDPHLLPEIIKEGKSVAADGCPDPRNKTVVTMATKQQILC